MTAERSYGGEVHRDVVVVGASAGGVESLRTFVGSLPDDLPAVVLVVLHVPPSGPSVLSRILERVSRLPVMVAKGDEDLRPGRILVAPPDQHLMVLGKRLRLTRGPRENGHRPAVDVLFRSAARSLNERVVAVVLSGTLDDGTAGAVAVDERGGVVLAQDPEEAGYPNMPRSVTANVAGARTAGAAELAVEVDRLCRSPLTRPRAEEGLRMSMVGADSAGSDVAGSNSTGSEESPDGVPSQPGVPAGFACPECFGAMFQIEDGGILRFRCRVGHAWTAAGLLVQQAQAMEGALWMALRILDEKAALSRQLADRALERGSHLSAARFGQHAAETAQSAELVRHLIGSIPALRTPPDLAEAVSGV